MRSLQDVPISGSNSAADLADYSLEGIAHPARNHPRVVAWLILKHSKCGDKIWDPMAGAGTMIIQARKFGRKASGWDISPWCQSILRGISTDEEILEQSPASESVDLIITSPPFLGTNHAPGDNEKQAGYTAKMRSRAGCHYDPAKIRGHLGQFRMTKDSVFWFILGSLYQSMYDALKPTGKLVVILRDRIHEGKIYPFVSKNEKLLDHIGFFVYGGHSRNIPKTARWQQREKLHPGQKHVGVEIALVLTKKRLDPPCLKRRKTLVTERLDSPPLLSQESELP